MVDTNVLNSNQMLVSWMTPQSLIDQGVSLYVIAVTPLCSSGSVAVTQMFTATPSDSSSMTISDLSKFNIDIVV